jgi:glutamyl-tRNA reductase
MLVGEEQIVGQVKDSLTAAQRARSAGPHLNKLFRTALEAGKSARTQTGIGRDAVSLGAAAVELASRHCAIGESRALVVGAGKMGTIVAKHLRTRGVAGLTIVNRTPAHAEQLAHALDAEHAGIDALPALLARSQLLITATGGGTHVVTAPMVRAALAANGGRLLIVDIAVPNDVEPNAAALPGATLYQIGDLREVVDATLDERRAEIPAVEAIVAERVREYVRWYQSRAAAPLIAALRTKAEAIRKVEIDRLFDRLPELDDRQRELIAGMSVSILNRLLHAPVTKLRESAAEGAAVSDSDLAAQLSDLAGLGRQLEAQLAQALHPPQPRPGAH